MMAAKSSKALLTTLMEGRHRFILPSWQDGCLSDESKSARRLPRFSLGFFSQSIHTIDCKKNLPLYRSGASLSRQ
jgi:hypothetical protein